MNDVGTDSGATGEDGAVGKDVIALSIALPIGMLLVVVLIIDFCLYRYRRKRKSNRAISAYFKTEQKIDMTVRPDGMDDDRNNTKDAADETWSSGTPSHTETQLVFHNGTDRNSPVIAIKKSHAATKTKSPQGRVKGPDTWSIPDTWRPTETELQELSARSLLSRTASLPVRKQNNQTNLGFEP